MWGYHNYHLGAGTESRFTRKQEPKGTTMRGTQKKVGPNYRGLEKHALAGEQVKLS